MNKRINVLMDSRDISHKDFSIPKIEGISKIVKIKEDSDSKTFGYKVYFKDEESIEWFKEFVAEYLITTAMKKYMNMYLKKDFTEETKTAVIKNHMSYKDYYFYYLPITRLVLDIFLKENDEINIDSFIKFNMNGMKKDIKQISILENIADGKLIEATPPQKNIPFNECDELFDIDEVVSHLIDSIDKEIAAEITTLYMMNECGKIVIRNNKKEIINMEFIEKITKSKIDIDCSDLNVLDENEKEKIISIACFIISLELFNIDTVVIDKTLEDKTVQEIEENIQSFTDKFDVPVDIFYTNVGE